MAQRCPEYCGPVQGLPDRNTSISEARHFTDSGLCIAIEL